MTPIENKSLKHVFDTLKSIDSYSIYGEMIKALKNNNIAALEEKSILSSLEKETAKLDKTIREAKEWIDILLQKEN